MIRVPGNECTFSEEHRFIAELAMVEDMVLDMDGVVDVSARVLAFITHYTKQGRTRFVNVGRLFREGYADILSQATGIDFNMLEG